ncbi:MAG TPA: hypothetical protein PKI14_01570 [Fervidobacterium sp.]|nr:hypothetical protein [Fervidobacterium sp.]
METVTNIFVFLGVAYLIEQVVLVRFAYKNRGFLVGQQVALRALLKSLFGLKLSAFEAKELVQVHINIASSDTQDPINTYQYIITSALHEISEDEVEYSFEDEEEDNESF